MHVSYNPKTQELEEKEYRSAALSLVKADIIIRHGYRMNAPCAVYSNR